MNLLHDIDPGNANVMHAIIEIPVDQRTNMR